MNRYIDALNRIRQNFRLEWLTPSQQVAYNVLRDNLSFLDEVNLWGARGVGKTFIGWVVAAQGLAIYKPCPEAVGQEESLPLQRIIVVDNSGWRRSEVRATLHRCRICGYDKIVLITTECVQEQMASVPLKLTDADIERVLSNLRSIGIAPYEDQPRNLWDLISPIRLGQ